MEEQLHSFANQMDYYTKYISSKPEYEMVGIYGDEGISGTSTRRRDGFNRMVEDALAGRIGLILTKSVRCVHHRNCAAKPAKLSMDSAEIEQRFRVN